MNPDSPRRFIHAVAVQARDIDFMGHVNNAVYLRWVEEAFLDHWRSKAPPAVVAAFRWVPLRHLIAYHRPAFLNEPVQAVLTLRRVSGSRAYYDASIEREGDLLAHVESTWRCLDAASMRPSRPGRDVVQWFGRVGPTDGILGPGPLDPHTGGTATRAAEEEK